MMDIPASPGAPYGRESEERERREGAGAGGDRGGKRRVKGKGWQVGKKEQVRVGCQPEAEGHRGPEDAEEEEGSEEKRCRGNERGTGRDR